MPGIAFTNAIDVVRASVRPSRNLQHLSHALLKVFIGRWLLLDVVTIFAGMYPRSACIRSASHPPSTY